MRLHEFPIEGPLDPFRCHLALRGDAPAVLLDGAREAGELARRAFVLFDPVGLVEVAAGSDHDIGGDPWRGLFDRLDAFAAVTAAGRAGTFRAGAAGLLGYDLGRHLERIPATAAASTRVPDLWFGLFHQGLEIDVATGRGTLFVVETEEGGRCGAAWVDGAVRRARAALESLPPVPSPPHGVPALTSNFSRAEYLDAVSRVRASILEGDVYQVNLSQRFAAPFDGDPAALYARLRTLNPAPFAALVEGDGFSILSSSPERFLEKIGRRVETRPIKGTRRLTGDAAVDAAARADLAAAEKDAAELAMIVDLHRNDLGRVSAYGSVVVDDAGALEAYATVLHRVAVIRATLADGRTTEDLLRATFPGGSITGAPKIAAMECIEALEGVRRGIFTGAIGWIGTDGDLDLNIAIRTLVLEGGEAHFHVGGGIVLDSDPAAEYQETLTKGRALAAALGGTFPDDPS